MFEGRFCLAGDNAGEDGHPELPRMSASRLFLRSLSLGFLSQWPWGLVLSSARAHRAHSLITDSGISGS